MSLRIEEYYGILTHRISFFLNHPLQILKLIPGNECGLRRGQALPTSSKQVINSIVILGINYSVCSSSVPQMRNQESESDEIIEFRLPAPAILSTQASSDWLRQKLPFASACVQQLTRQKKLAHKSIN